MEENKVLKNLDDSRKKIIIKVISFYNIKEFLSNLNEEEVLFCKLIRDVDKFDIFRVVIEYEREWKNNFNLVIDNLFFILGYNNELLEDIFLSRRISNNVLKNYNDRKIYELSWILDLNFFFLFNYIKEKRVVKILIDCLFKNEEINKFYKYLE